jgi:hypothetical protein
VSIRANEQRRLVDAVDDAVGRDAVEGAAEAREGGEQVGLVDDVVDELTGLDGAGPPGEGGDTDAALEEVALAAAEDVSAQPM